MTRQRLRRRGVEDPDVRALPLNDLRAALLAGAELAREPEPPYLYARGLVGCLDAEARANLWRLCSMSLRRGGALFLEYAATRPGLPRPPARRPGPPGEHRRAASARSRPPVVASSTARTGPDSTSSTSPTRTSPAWRSAGTREPTGPTAQPEERQP